MDTPERRFFVGDMKEPLFEETHGYFMGFFMKGKFLPDGSPADILTRDDVECAIMELSEYDPSKPHFHKIACEITYCLSGRLHLIVDQKDEIDLTENQFLVIQPGVVLQNPTNEPGTRIFVVKFPSIPSDKFYA